MLDYMNDGGIIMWAIAALSFAAFAVAAERLFFYRKASGNAQALERAVKAALEAGDMEEALRAAGASDSSPNRLFSGMLGCWKEGAQEVKEVSDELIRREIYRWEKHLFIMEIIGKLAPMLGLLGTVMGMVEMFGSLHLGGQISAEAVTGGIWKALYTTVAGLTAAIPVIFIHGLLNSSIDAEEEKLRRGADFLLRLRRRLP